MQGPHDPRAAFPDARLQGRGPKVFLEVDVGEALPGEPLKKSHALRFRSVEFPPIPRASKRKDHGKPHTGWQASRCCLLRAQEVVDAQLEKIDATEESFRVEEIRGKRLLSQDEADVPPCSQKSLL